MVLEFDAFLVPSGARACPTSAVAVLFGGSGGSFEASKIGAIILAPSIEGVLAPWLVPLFDKFDIDETTEKVDETDSVESRLFIWFDGLLGGNAGDGCVESLRGGSRGGGAGVAGSFCPVLVIVGGGSTPFCFGPLGSLPISMLLCGDIVCKPVVFLR